LSELPISARLETVLRKKGFARLGDLQGRQIGELRRVKGCGQKGVREFVHLLEHATAGGFLPSKKPFSPSEIGNLLISLNTILANLPSRNRDILLLRLGATDNRPLTLEEIGSKFDVTRERIRQIVQKAVPAMRKKGGSRLIPQISGVAVRCREMVCPLTPALLSQWLGENSNPSRSALGFYVRLLAALNPTISGWPKGQEPAAPRHARAKAILSALEGVLQDSSPKLPLKSAFDLIRQNNKMQHAGVGEFLEAVKHARSVVVHFDQPDRPDVRLRYVRMASVAKSVLQVSDGPLTPEEIISRARNMFGNELVGWDPRTFL
jgi:Sigma-70, region 4